LLAVVTIGSPAPTYCCLAVGAGAAEWGNHTAVMDWLKIVLTKINAANVVMSLFMNVYF
jgi:hypothetical protein